MQTHLFRRGAHYHVRRRLPLSIARSAGSSHIVRSLRTTDPKVASSAVRLVSSLFDDWFRLMNQTGQQPSADDLKRVIARIFQTLLQRDELERASRPNVDIERAELELYEPVWINDGSDPDGPDEIQLPKARLAAEHEIDVWQDRLARNDSSAIMDDLDTALASEGIDVDRASPEYRLLAHRGMRAALRAAEISLDRENGIFREDAFEEAPLSAIETPQPAPAKPIKPLAPLLSTEWEHFVAVKAGSDWKDDNATDANIAWRLWTSLIGDRRIDQLDKEPLEFRDLLERLPALNGKSVFIGLSAREAIERADAIERGEYRPDAKFAVKAGQPVGRLSKKAMNKHMGFFNTLYDTKRIQRHVPDNPFLPILWSHDSIRLQRKQSGAGRTNLTSDLLMKLFASPVWRGMKSKGRLNQPGDLIIKSGPLFWLPLMSIFSGMRLTEAAQLWCEDIVETNGSWWIHVKEGPGRELKSDASARAIPMHPELVKIGLPDYVEKCRHAGDLRLFPDLIIKPATGHPQSGMVNSDAASKRFGYYRKQIGVGGQWEDFHATRHTFVTEAHNCGVPDRMIAFLVGHEGGAIEQDTKLRMTNRVYFGGYRPDVLIDAMSRIRHPGLDFSKLYEEI